VAKRLARRFAFRRCQVRIPGPADMVWDFFQRFSHTIILISSVISQIWSIYTPQYTTTYPSAPILTGNLGEGLICGWAVSRETFRCDSNNSWLIMITYTRNNNFGLDAVPPFIIILIGIFPIPAIGYNRLSTHANNANLL
jgi:hypothetical protein